MTMSDTQSRGHRAGDRPAARATPRREPASCALWRRLDVPGHDAARLRRASSGWTLQGTAVFLHADGPACVGYAVDLNVDWTTRRARIDGFIGGRRLRRRIERHDDGWTLDGAHCGLAQLADIDFGFTPATNLPQLRRMALAVGDARELRVAWLDVEDGDATTLVELAQHYERRSESTYWYESPQGPYAAMLEVAGNGFVATYPGLWQLERQPSALRR